MKSVDDIAKELVRGRLLIYNFAPEDVDSILRKDLEHLMTGTGISNVRLVLDRAVEILNELGNHVEGIA